MSGVYTDRLPTDIVQRKNHEFYTCNRHANCKDRPSRGSNWCFQSEKHVSVEVSLFFV